MIIFKSGSTKVSSVDFCCPKMARKVLLGEVKCDEWLSKSLEWQIKGEYFQHCLYCGAKVQTLQAPTGMISAKISWKE